MKTLLVLCIIKIATCHSIPFIINAQVKGKVIKKSKHHYYVDFQKDIKAKFPCRDIKKLMVPINKCMEIDDESAK